MKKWRSRRIRRQGSAKLFSGQDKDLRRIINCHLRKEEEGTISSDEEDTVLRSIPVTKK
jgi:hypothetical protein